MPLLASGAMKRAVRHAVVGVENRSTREFDYEGISQLFHQWRYDVLDLDGCVVGCWL